MARPPKITPTLTAQVITRLQRGEKKDDIAAALGVSKSTVDRAGRLAKVPRMQAQPPPPVSDEAGEVPTDIPGTVDGAQIRAWIAKVVTMAQAAEHNGEVGAFATLATRYVQLLAHLHKTEPPPPPDPNANPDMIEARERGRAMMHVLIDQVLK